MLNFPDSFGETKRHEMIYAVKLIMCTVFFGNNNHRYRRTRSSTLWESLIWSKASDDKMAVSQPFDAAVLVERKGSALLGNGAILPWMFGSWF